MHVAYRLRYKCDKILDTIMGLILGGSLGVLWNILIKMWDAKYLFFSKEALNKCSLNNAGKLQKFSCKYT